MSGKKQTYRGTHLTEKPAADMTDAECRTEYREIRARWIGTSADKAATAAFDAKIAKFKPATPQDWIRAARRHTEKCWKCNGSGIYGWGAIVNGVPTHSGPCFMCNGKGVVNDADNRRNWGYWMFYVKVSIT